MSAARSDTLLSNHVRSKRARRISAGPEDSTCRGRRARNAFVCNSHDDTVSVIETCTHTVVATVPTGKARIDPTFTNDRQTSPSEYPLPVHRDIPQVEVLCTDTPITVDKLLEQRAP